MYYPRYYYGDVEIHVPMTDHMGNIRHYYQIKSAAGSLTGQVSANFEYDAFGREVRAWGATTGAFPTPGLPPHKPFTDELPFHFSSKFTDQESGLNSYGYRFYSPDLGRWLSRDPINESGFILIAARDGVFQRKEEATLYGFLSNEPNSHIDALGLTLCAPLIWRAGCIQFVGCTTAQLSEFRVIPESPTGTMTAPISGWNCDADGFWYDGVKDWYKVPGNCYAIVTCFPSGGYSSKCCCNACFAAGRSALGKAPCGLQPNSGKTSISPHNYPF